MSDKHDAAIKEIDGQLTDSAKIDWRKTKSGMQIEFELSSVADLSDVMKIELKNDGTWDYVREVDDGRDPYNRDFSEPYEP